MNIDIDEHFRNLLEGENMRLQSENAELLDLLEKAKNAVLECQKKHEETKSILMFQNLQLRMQIKELRARLMKK